MLPVKLGCIRLIKRLDGQSGDGGGRCRHKKGTLSQTGIYKTPWRDTHKTVMKLNLWRPSPHEKGAPPAWGAPLPSCFPLQSIFLKSSQAAWYTGD